MGVDTVTFLKNRARKAYQRYTALMDRAHYNCGANLAAHINPEISEAAREFNEFMTRLAAVDKNCPAWTKLPEGT